MIDIVRDHGRRGNAAKTESAVSIVGAAVIAALIFLLSRGTTVGGCAGGYREGGQFTDAAGTPASSAGECVLITFPPLPGVLLLLAAVTAAGLALSRYRTGFAPVMLTVLVLAGTTALWVLPTYGFLAPDPISEWQQTGILELPPAWVGADVTWSTMDPAPPAQ